MRSLSLTARQTPLKTGTVIATCNCFPTRLGSGPRLRCPCSKVFQLRLNPQTKFATTRLAERRHSRSAYNKHNQACGEDRRQEDAPQLPTGHREYETTIALNTNRKTMGYPQCYEDPYKTCRCAHNAAPPPLISLKKFVEFRS